ncbi:lysophospholipid acyltransferase family protein [Hyphococcus flavus]|uniref:Lysophospholipid acyltransferase family protein n=1 Tax=Hyphococcus flavus TaxID=1866326 RepID=A0AAF0CG34_9PROT|nr:lysophospholipid acyltransferase family protein [Hyphococcus flavus]WDI33056.1 lysophospholipid acyltransferase family protein [Hyphococcus flavus]
MLLRIRSICFAAFIVFFVGFIGFFCLPAALFGRRAAQATVKSWSKTGLDALKLITGMTYRIEGAENIPTGGAIVAANHQSMWETIALVAILPRPVISLKQELLWVPVYGWWAKLAGHIPIDRKGGAKALRAFTRIAKERIDEGNQVIVFPEGTRIQPGQTSRFLPGAAGIYTTANAPCTPAAHDSGRFWTHPGIERKPGVVTLRFLPPIAPGLDRKTFLKELKAQIEAARPDLENTPLEKEKSVG